MSNNTRVCHVVLLNGRLIEGQFTPRVSKSIGDMWTGIITANGKPLKILAWLRDANMIKNASVGDRITCHLVKSSITIDDRFNGSWRLVSGTLKINEKEEKVTI